MMTSLKLIKMGNSVGVVLPKEVLAKLRVDKGDTLYAVETADGIELSAYNAEFARQMEVAEKIMRKDRDVLKKLAE
ncbi:MAG: AbrB/MazE/SpoVT family DNA-binding domain-containing protein [Gammaproteobacteria bacterium]